MKTKSKKRGSSTSAAEVSHISTHGVWVLVGEIEFHLGFDDYPWFRDARISEIQSVELLYGTHLRWESLDVDIELDSLKTPERYPLIYR